MKQVGVPDFAEELGQKAAISVGVLDTGINGDHSDLLENYDSSLSYDFIDDQSGGADENGHGTEVAGIIGASVNGKGVF